MNMTGRGKPGNRGDFPLFPLPLEDAGTAGVSAHSHNRDKDDVLFLKCRKKSY
jgi:hypothetical protein